MIERAADSASPFSCMSTRAVAFALETKREGDREDGQVFFLKK
jgi:hypothetical protein